MPPLPDVDTTREAAGLLAKYELEHLARLLGALEARELLDVRALSNLQYGSLRVPGPQRDVTQYCAMLKELDEAQEEAARLMGGHAQGWYASRVLDLVEEAARMQAIADMAIPAPAGVPSPSPLTAGELANALTGLAGRAASEASKESSTTHEAERLAKVYEIYSLRVREGEYGNRRALYLANKYMGPSSEHLYPSSEQMPYAAIKAANGGVAKAADGFEGRVDADGRVAFTPTDPTAVSAANSRQVSQQVKLKIMTLFIELCGEDVPAGFEAGRTGVMPGREGRCQLGLDEVLEYCALLDRGAKDVPVKEAWETIVDGAERNIREMTRAPTHYTLGNALQHEVTPLTAAIVQFKATHQAQKLAGGTSKKVASPSKKESGDEGAPGAGGPNGTYSKKQISAMLKQIGASPYGKGKGKAKGKGGGPANASSGWYVGGHGDWGYGGWGSPNWGMSNGGGASAGWGAGGKASHLCRDFQAGRCQRGDQCRFQHSTGGEKGGS